MVNQTGHIDQIKQLNTGIVYRIIDQQGPISRIVLSKQAQLAPASITKITRELMDAHLIKELEFPVLGLRGRPAIGLVTESEGWQFLAIHIKNRKINISLKEISTKTLAETEYPFDVKGNKPFIELLFELISLFFATNRNQLERVTAISILLDGILDSHLGIIYKLPDFEIDELHIGQYLTEKTGLPIYLYSSVNALALADYFSHLTTRTAKNIIYLQLQNVVNVTVLSHGYALDASNRKPILFGHIQIDNDEGDACYCGGTGCLETFVSMSAILRQANSLLADYPNTILNQNSLTIESICHGITVEDELCLYLLKNIAAHLSKQLSIMINLLGTELILINSPLNAVSDVFFTYLHHYISLQASPLYNSHLHIETSDFSAKDSETSLIQQSLYDGTLLLQLLQG